MTFAFQYLDCGRGQWLDSTTETSADEWPYLDYCAPYHNWRQIYSYDPLDSIPEESQYLVLGAEVSLWSEQTDPVNLDEIIWPRSMAAAEVLWSGAKDGQGNNRSQVEASPRLAEMRERMVLRGVKSGPVQMVYCTQNDGYCNVASPTSSNSTLADPS